MSYRVTQRFLASTLIASLKRRGLIPTSDEAFNEADFLALIDEEMRTYILPLLRKTREDFLLARAETTVRAGFNRYLLPARCAAEAVRHVALGPSFTPLRRISSDDAHRGGGGFYIEDDAVVLVDTPDLSGASLRFVYFYRPNLLVAESACARVAAVDIDARQVTVTATPGTFTTAESYDFVKGTPGFRCHDVNRLISGVAANVMTFEGDLPVGLAVDDYVCLAGETPVPQIPAEAHPLLAQRVTYVVSNALGPAKSRPALEQLTQMEQGFESLFAVRDGSPQYVQNYNSPGWVKYRSRGWRA